MMMKVRRGISPHDISLFCKRASRVTLSQVVDHVTVQEELRAEGQARRTQFTIDINFYPKHEYQEEHDLEPAEILAAFGVKFPLTLKKEILSEMKKLDADLKSQMAQLGQGKKIQSKESGAIDDEEESFTKKKDDGEGSEVGDGDADDAKHARQKKQQATYDSDDEDAEEVDNNVIEAEDDEGEEVADELIAKKAKPSPLKSVVNRASELFQRHLQHCTSFSCNEAGCTFKLEVSSFDMSMSY
jgi:DNA-directed RNA polymerase I subunit RPA1